MTTLSPGAQLGHYRVVAALDAGGMGEVYRATDTKLDRDVAIKVLPEELSRDKERRARFAREAKLLAQLNHPGIATLYGLEQSNGQQFLVMELVTGETLRERIARGPIPVEEALPLLREMAEGLEAAHEKGILHRDFKPANIMITEAGKIIILDFGLAKAFAVESQAQDLSQSPTLTRGATESGVLLGTAPYMSPEQATGKAVDRRTDNWAFGCVLFEMLTGKRAFEGESVSETLAAILKVEPDWDLLPADTPPKLAKLLRRCLQKDGRWRLRDIGDGWLEIEDVLAGASEEIGGQVLAPPRPIWRRALPWGIAAVFVVAMVVLGIPDMWREDRVVRSEISAPSGTRFHLEADNPGPPALSPDGHSLAFSARDAEGNVRLYIRSLDHVEARDLSGTDRAMYPFWSPDSRWIGFFAGGQLKKIEVTGGAPQTICDAFNGRGGSWSRDDVIVFAPGGSGLHRVSAAGGASQPIELDRVQGVNSLRHPRFLPDGRRFLYLARNDQGAESNVVRVGSLDGGPSIDVVHSLVAADYASGHLLFLRDQELVAQRFDVKRLSLVGETTSIGDGVAAVTSAAVGFFSASHNGELIYLKGRRSTGTAKNLEWVDRTGKRLGILGASGGGSVFPSPDGQSVAVPIFDSAATYDLWIYDIPSQNRSRFSFDPGSEQSAVWSPDGGAVIFSVRSRGRSHLYRKAVGGSEERELLLESDVTKRPTSWSPDGNLLAFHTDGDIWVLPLEGEKEPYAFIQTAALEHRGVFSPNGRWMAYESNESGQAEVYVTPFPGPGRKWQVSTDGGLRPWWRRDGREIIYQEEGGLVVAVAVEAREDTFLVGADTPLFEAPFFLNHDNTFTFATMPDAQRFLVVKPAEEEDSAPLTLVVNWTAELER